MCEALGSPPRMDLMCSPPRSRPFGRESGGIIDGIARVGGLSIRTVSEASIIHLRDTNAMDGM